MGDESINSKALILNLEDRLKSQKSQFTRDDQYRARKSHIKSKSFEYLNIITTALEKRRAELPSHLRQSGGFYPPDSKNGKLLGTGYPDVLGTDANGHLVYIEKLRIRTQIKLCSAGMWDVQFAEPTDENINLTEDALFGVFSYGCMIVDSLHRLAASYLHLPIGSRNKGFNHRVVECLSLYRPPDATLHGGKSYKALADHLHKQLDDHPLALQVRQVRNSLQHDSGAEIAYYAEPHPQTGTLNRTIMVASQEGNQKEFFFDYIAARYFHIHDAIAQSIEMLLLP